MVSVLPSPPGMSAPWVFFSNVSMDGSERCGLVLFSLSDD